MRKRPLIAVSVLAADFGCLAQAIRMVEDAGADWVHVDVMDGAFVPPITFGSKMVTDLRRHTRLPFDVHLMVQQPERHVDAFLDAGADHLTFHAEAARDRRLLLEHIRSRGGKPGLSIAPPTPIGVLEDMAALCDLILVMTVNPGFGGQELIPSCLDKVRDLALERARRGHHYLIEVDGGINADTAAMAREAGADVLVAGSAVFDAPDPAAALRAIRLGQ